MRPRYSRWTYGPPDLIEPVDGGRDPGRHPRGEGPIRLLPPGRFERPHQQFVVVAVSAECDADVRIAGQQRHVGDVQAPVVQCGVAEDVSQVEPGPGGLIVVLPPAGCRVGGYRVAVDEV